MPISFECPACQRKYQVRDELAGKAAKCSCGQSLSIPHAASPTPPRPAAAPAVPVAPASTPAAPHDPFAGLNDEIMSQGSLLQPVASRGKQPGKKKGKNNPWLIVAVGGGAVVVLLLVVMIVVLLPGGDSSPSAASPPPAPVAAAPPEPIARWATPEAAFEAMKKAIGQEDWTTLYEVLSPKSQQDVIYLMLAPLQMAQSLPGQLGGESTRPLNELAAKYGFDKIEMPSGMEGMQEYGKRFAAKADEIKDKAALFADIMKALNESAKQEPLSAMGGVPGAGESANTAVSSILPSIEEAQLTDLKITENTASATINMTVNGQTKSDPVQFVKIDGDWRVEMPTPSVGVPSS